MPGEFVTGLRDLASRLTTSFDQSRSYVSLTELDYANEAPTGKEFIFQYFPETITVSKQVTRTAKDIPGGSLPLYQWVSSGERSISFTARFSCDIDLLAELPVVVPVFGNAPTVDVNTLSERANNLGEGDRNVDIREAINYLQRYMLPKYDTTSALGTQLSRAPRKAKLLITNSGIGGAGGYSQTGSLNKDSLNCVMTQCEVTYDSFFPSGLPRLVSVQLAFAQIAQIAGGVEFPSVTEDMDLEATTTSRYFLAVRRKGGTK